MVKYVVSKIPHTAVHSAKCLPAISSVKSIQLKIKMRYLLIALFCALSVYIAWLLLVACNFFYSTLHERTTIGDTIIRYAPHNRFGKGDFVATSLSERARLFAAIVDAIRHQGNGLDTIVYTTTSGVKPLLTQDEIVHLLDVSYLVTALETAGVIVVLLSIVLMLVTLRRPQLRLLVTPQALLKFYALLFLISIGVMLFGARSVFYWLHEMLFPNQWFFYYQESLMSTMMEAPKLFAYIALLWLIFIVGIMALVCWLWNRACLRAER